MRGKDALGLPFNDGLHIGGKAGMQRFLVVVSGVVLSILHRFKNTDITAAHLVPEFDPGAVQLARHAGAAFGVRPAEIPRYALQLCRKFSALQ